MTVEEFIEKYDPELNESDNDNIRQYETYGEDYEIVKNSPLENVWTAMDGPGRSIIYVNGRWWVNRLYYIICKKPWEVEFPGEIEVIDK